MEAAQRFKRERAARRRDRTLRRPPRLPLWWEIPNLLYRQREPGEPGRGNTSGNDRGGGYPSWDIAPPPEYFQELARVSKNQIIWGGNYFALPPTRCFLVWRKLTISENFSMAMAEYAWTSFNDNAKLFEAAPQGKKGEKRFHPTQKPVELYKWIFSRYAAPGFKILDTHLGSGSSRIAAYDLGFDFVGCEIDKTYFELQEERFSKHSSQCSLFVEPEQIELTEV